MKDVDKIILAVQSMPEASYATTGTVYTSDVIDLITEAMEGKVLVPVYPTTEMIEAAARHCYSHDGSYGVADTSTRLDAIRVYKAMLSTIRTSGE